MGFFDRFKSGSRRFVAPDRFEASLQGQLAMTPQTMAQLRTLGVSTESRLKLEFFFYTDSVDKAAALTAALSALAYEVEHGVSASDKKLRVITGWSTALQMNDDVVLAWTEPMSRLGFAHDCEFDGWGTNPTQ